MMTVSRVLEANTSDQEIYEAVIKAIVNIVQSCFAPSHLRREALDARVLDRLCTAQFPTKIVLELQNRRVPGLGEGLMHSFQDGTVILVYQFSLHRNGSTNV